MTLKRMQQVVVVGLSSAIVATAVISVRAQDASHDDSEKILTLDHYVPVSSKVPGLEGELTQIYVRERARAGTVLRSTSLRNRVVLFVHGAGTPAEVAFDPASEGYSWMASGRRWVRCLRDGHDGLRTLDAPGANERPVQFSQCPAGVFGAGVARGDLHRELSIRDDHDRLRLARPRHGCHVSQEASRRRPCELGGVVAWRPSRRWLRSSAS